MTYFTRSVGIPVTGPGNSITAVTLRVLIQESGEVWVATEGLFEAVEGNISPDTGLLMDFTRQLDVDFCDHTHVFGGRELPVIPLETAVEAVNYYIARKAEVDPAGSEPDYLLPGVRLDRPETAFPEVLRLLIAGEIGSSERG